MSQQISEILRKIDAREFAVGVIGLGYVGLPLALEFAGQGFSVIGFDIDPIKADALNGGRSYIRHIDSERVDKAVTSGKLEATVDFSRIASVQAVLICVPTPWTNIAALI